MKRKAKVKIEDPLKAIYHLKIYLLKISPMIYRRFSVPDDTNIAQLHHLVQLIMGWVNDHLHHFHIWGIDFGISYYGQPGFRSDPCKVSIGSLGFKAGDLFTYIHDYGDWWLHEIRVEKIENSMSDGIVPKCIEGKRASKYRLISSSLPVNLTIALKVPFCLPSFIPSLFFLANASFVRWDIKFRSISADSEKAKAKNFEDTQDFLTA